MIKIFLKSKIIQSEIIIKLVEYYISQPDFQVRSTFPMLLVEQRALLNLIRSGEFPTHLRDYAMQVALGHVIKPHKNEFVMLPEADTIYFALASFCAAKQRNDIQVNF